MRFHQVRIGRLQFNWGPGSYRNPPKRLWLYARWGGSRSPRWKVDFAI